MDKFETISRLFIHYLQNKGTDSCEILTFDEVDKIKSGHYVFIPWEVWAMRKAILVYQKLQSEIDSSYHNRDHYLYYKETFGL